MSVLNKDVIDSIGINIETGSVLLINSDHLGWAEETQLHLSFKRRPARTGCLRISAGAMK
ncbi:DUF6572 domain-containing protein [Herbaspirillum sp. CAH-3]|uniref:DUF6572 domain-containing protein n=1 Tax=Herbaspirillum TaxID=963 RepID=UPI00351BE107